MNIILLSGGSGKRLWPLSNDIRSKQFIKIFKGANGEYESMVQRMYRQIRAVDSDAEITIATSRSQVAAIRNQIGSGVGICVEPCRRDTFPAIALAAAYLADVRGVALTEAVIVCPVDPYVEESYFEAFRELDAMAAEGESNLTLLGMEPTYPSAKYGYIMPESRERVAKVAAFKEKPDEKTAEEYIEQGALWNGGVFAFQLGYVLEKAHELMDFDDYADLLEKYESAGKISFDYAVVEKEKDISVLRYNGAWKDLGTWNTLTEAMENTFIGKTMHNETCENLHIINELNVPIVCMGIKDAVVAASAEGILVSDKKQSSYIKPYVDQIHQQVMFAEKTWGSYLVVDVEEMGMTVKVTLNPGHRMNYHSHENRDEVWTILSGNGYAVLDGQRREVKSGDVISMPRGCKHTVVADSELKIMEVQMGKDINVRDKILWELEE